MGTNFYLRGWKSKDSMDPTYHIGKRSAAGVYCWDCGVTLCAGGINGVHYSKYVWLKSCPKCGGKPGKESLASGAAGRELGFNSSPFARKTGVNSCSSFSWVIPKEKVFRSKAVWDEYGRKYIMEEFRSMLEECPIQYEKYGEWFC